MSQATDFSVPDLQLDARQRAMLEEMGIKVWWPAADAPTVPERAALPAQPGAMPPLADASGAPARPPASVPSPAPPVQPATRVAPRAADAPPGRSAGAAAVDAGILVDAPRHLFGAANASGGWLIVADMPPDLHGHHGAPLEGDEGRLLANMLRALRLDAGETPVHLMRTHRGERMTEDGAPQPAGPALGAQFEALAPRLVLAMGPLAAQFLLQRREPIGKLRGPATPLAQRPETLVVATYHPAYLLRNSADKGRAWVDLCTAAAAFAGAGSQAGAS